MGPQGSEREPDREWCKPDRFLAVRRAQDDEQEHGLHQELGERRSAEAVLAGECSAYPFDANPLARSKPGAPLAIRYRTAAATMPPTTSATM
jgi:hypothetical protein